MGYQPIANYGIIGNMRTAALVGMNGSIDWFCTPRFDSPSVFAAILDDEKGGRFKIAPPIDGVTQQQMYWPGTNVLISRFLSSEGVAEVTDFMPVGARDGGSHHQIVRRVNAVRGTMPYIICSDPSGFRSRVRSSSQLMNCTASSVNPTRMRPYRVNAESRIQV